MEKLDPRRTKYLLNEIKRLRQALKEIRSYVDDNPEKASAPDCAIIARQALNCKNLDYEISTC